MFFKGECDTETNKVWKEGPMETGRVLVSGPVMSPEAHQPPHGGGREEFLLEALDGSALP